MEDEDIPKVMILNRICLPENYPEFFFRELKRLYPKLFIVAEKNAETVLKEDPPLLKLLTFIRSKPDKKINISDVVSFKTITYDEAKQELEQLLEISNSLPPQFRFLRKDYEDGLSFYTLIDDPKIVGYIMCRLEKGVSNFGFKWVKKGHVVSIAVDEPYRKQGIGEALLKKAIKEMEAQEAFEQVLEVRTNNYDAIHIYQNLNFKIVKTLRHYYHDGADAYLMARVSEEKS